MGRNVRRGSGFGEGRKDTEWYYEERRAASFASVEIVSETNNSITISCANGVQPTIAIPYRLTLLFRFRSN